MLLYQALLSNDTQDHSFQKFTLGFSHRCFRLKRAIFPTIRQHLILHGSIFILPRGAPVSTCLPFFPKISKIPDFRTAVKWLCKTPSQVGSSTSFLHK